MHAPTETIAHPPRNYYSTASKWLTFLKAVISSIFTFDFLNFKPLRNYRPPSETVACLPETITCIFCCISLLRNFILICRCSFFVAHNVKHNYHQLADAFITAPLWSRLFQHLSWFGILCRLGPPAFCNTIACKLKQKPLRHEFQTLIEKCIQPPTLNGGALTP